MGNNDKEEPPTDQRMVDDAFPENIKDEVVDTVTSNEEIKEEKLILDEPLNGSNVEKCTEEELGKAESVSISNDDILQNITDLSAKVDSLNQLFSEKKHSIWNIREKLLIKCIKSFRSIRMTFTHRFSDKFFLTLLKLEIVF